MKILVTGGAGFIGSHLCEALLVDKHSVLVIDNLQTGSLKNIAHLQKKRNFKFVKHDIIKPFSAPVDFIINLACPASPIHYQSDPVKTILTNVEGTINVLKLAQKRKIPILQGSTSEVYGDPAVHPQREDYLGNVNPIGTRACYDEGKRCAETLCFDFHREYGVDIRVIRIFNTYGPRMAKDDGRVVSNFIVAALEGKPVTIYGKGLQTRSFQYVDDLIAGILKMMKVKNFTGPVNLGNPDEFTMIELARKVIQLTNSKSKIIFCKLPSDDPRRRKPDISLAKKILKWEPSVKLDEGLEKTIEYFKRELRIKN